MSTSGRRVTTAKIRISDREWGLAVAKLDQANKARPGCIRGHDNRASEREFFPPLALPCLPSFPFLPSPLPFPFPFSFHPLFLPSLPLSPTISSPSPYPPVYAPLALPRSGSTSPSSSNRTAGQCATHSDHVQPTCPTRPCSSSNYRTGTEGALHCTRNSGIYHHPHRRAIRECPELFVPLLALYFIPINPSLFTQPQCVHLPPSRPSGMAPLVRSGSAIGMGRYPPIDPHQRCRPSSATGQSMQIRNSWPSNA